MATIPHTDLDNGTGAIFSEIELTGTDDLVLSSGRNALFVRNDSGGLITLNILGDAATGTKACAGGGEVDLSLGLDVAIGIGETAQLSLLAQRDYLTGVIAVTGGAASVFAGILDV